MPCWPVFRWTPPNAQAHAGMLRRLTMQTNKDRLKVVWGDKPDETCWLDYALDEKQTANASGFTNLKLRCEVTGGKEATAQTVPTIK